MDTCFTGWDRGGCIAQLQHARIWASLTTILTIATIAVSATIGRQYDAGERGFEQPRAQV